VVSVAMALQVALLMSLPIHLMSHRKEPVDTYPQPFIVVMYRKYEHFRLFGLLGLLVWPALCLF